MNPQSGDSHWVFESSDPNTKIINATDSRFFWIALYSQPLLWIALALVAIFSFEFIWLILVGMFFFILFGMKLNSNSRNIVIALCLTVTNTLAFSRCDKFSQASNIADRAMFSSGFAGNFAGGMIGRFFSRR